MIDKIKVGDITHSIKDSSVLDKYRTAEKKVFKTASDYQVATLSNGEIVANTDTRIVLTNKCVADENMIFSVKDGYKFSVTYYFTVDNLASCSDFGWCTSKIIVPKGVTFRTIIAKEDNAVIETSEYENLVYEVFDEFHYGEYNEKGVIDNIHFFVSSHEDGYPCLFLDGAVKARTMCLDFLRFGHEVKVVNSTSNYGFSVFLYNDDGTEYLGELDYVSEIWAGTRKEATIPANTTFRLYLRKLDNSSFGETHWTPVTIPTGFTIEVDTCSAIVNQARNYKLADNNYYGELKSNNYKRLFLDEWVDFNAESLQSTIIDTDKKRIIKIDASTTAKIYDYNGKSMGEITKANTEHDNDVCYIGNGIAYIVGAYYSTSYIKSFFKWNIINNTATSIDLSAITNNSNGSYRVVGGVCETYRNSGVLYIVCADWYNDGSAGLNHQEGDKLSVYTYDTVTGTTNLVFETDWDCVYIQGATCLNDILYVACNTQTEISASNYKGITIKMFDTKAWELIDEIIIEGNFETEGLNYIIENGTPKLTFGIGKYQEISKLVKMELPF